MLNKISFRLLALLCSLFVVSSALAAGGQQKTIVGFFTTESQQYFETKILPFFAEQTRGCGGCEVRNLTPYKSDGTFDEEVFAKRLEQVPGDVAFLYFDFNLRHSEKTNSLIESLNRKKKQGQLIVASAGMPRPQESSSPLSRTLFGKVQDVLIIGELTDRDRLLPMSFFGPEMLTAIRSPKSADFRPGSSSLVFAARLAKEWHRKSADEWVDHFREKKNNTKRLWPDVNEFFRP